MSSGLALRSDPAPILACTVSRNVHHFDLLIEDMEAELGEAWGDLTFDEARAFLDQPEAA
jgi:pilus assembly protein CpaE